jgi:hypothetical protein
VKINSITIFLLAYILLAPNLALSGSHGVKGYIKKDGTYVAPHRQTNPNKTQRDNWSSKPNVNPYTGKEGTKEPKK